MKIGTAIPPSAPSSRCGRWSAARVGETLTVAATVFREGMTWSGPNVVVTDPAGTPGPVHADELRRRGTDRYEATIYRPSQGVWSFQIEAWADPVATWRHSAQVKAAAGQDDAEAGGRSRGWRPDARTRAPDVDPVHQPAVTHAIQTLRNTALTDVADRLAPVLCEPGAAPRREPAARAADQSAPFEITVDRERALFSSWYEFFPRSEGEPRPAALGHLQHAAKRLPAIADLGFDVSTCRRSHPSVRSNRKGPNNTLTPAPERSRQPVGDRLALGGHDAVHPDLGTIDDFDAFVARRPASSAWRSRSISRCNARPTIPGPTAHPEWFTTKSDGTHRLRREPAEEVPGHLPDQLRQRLPTGLYAEILPGGAALDVARRAHLPGRQPAHQAGAVLGAADRRDQGAATPTCSSWPRPSPGRR